jgi:hypothetical protein
MPLSNDGLLGGRIAEVKILPPFFNLIKKGLQSKVSEPLQL